MKKIFKQFMHVINPYLFLSFHRIQVVENETIFRVQTLQDYIFIVEQGELFIDQKSYSTNKVIHISNGSTITYETSKYAIVYQIQYQKQIIAPNHLYQIIKQHVSFSQKIWQTACNQVPMIFNSVYDIMEAQQKNKDLRLKYQFEHLFLLIFEDTSTYITTKLLAQQYITWVEKYYMQPFFLERLLQRESCPLLAIEYQMIQTRFQTLNNYIEYLRKQTAQYYMATSNYKVKDVMNYLTVKNDVVFSTVFKAWTNTSPQQFKYKKSILSEKDIINENRFHYTNNQFARIIAKESEHNNEMKKYMPISFLLSLLLLLTACDNTKVEEQEQATPKASKVETRLFTDEVGREVEIPVAPKRIVTDQYVEALLALDIKPVGTSEHVLSPSYLKDQVSGVESIGNPINIENILDLKPDLIITMIEPGEENLEKLEKIAPTVVVPFMDGNDVYTQLRNIAKIVNKEQAADTWIANLEAKAEKVRAEIQPIISSDEEVAIVRTFAKDEPTLYGARNVGHVLYRLLALKPVPFIAEKIEKDPNYGEFVSEGISLETLPDYAGDWLFVFSYDYEDSERDKIYADLMATPVWKNLDAVKNKKFIILPKDPYFMYSPIAIEKSLDDIVGLITEQTK